MVVATTRTTAAARALCNVGVIWGRLKELLASKDDDGAKTTVDGPALTGAAAEAVALRRRKGRRVGARGKEKRGGAD